MSAVRKRARRVAIAVAVGVLGGLLIAIPLWIALRPKPPADTVRGPIERSGEGTEAKSVDSSDGAVGNPGASAPATSVPDAPPGQSAPGGKGATGEVPVAPPSAAAFPRAAKIAYRLAGIVYVSAEDGSGATQVVQSVAGPFALSPDARTLALVDSGTLRLVDVASGAVKAVCAAAEGAPAWSPDSAWFVCMREGGSHAGTEAWRVNRDGSGARRLGSASEVAISNDGSLVVLLPGQGDTVGGHTISVSRNGGVSFTGVKVSGWPTGVAATSDRVWVAITDADGSKPRIVSQGVDGKGERPVVGAPPGIPGRMVSYGNLTLSPDGRRLVFCAVADDGFSRLFSTRSEGGETVSLSSRRDDYPRGFTATGDAVLFVEGNAFQGESTALWRVSPDGTHRLLVVDGAM